MSSVFNVDEVFGIAVTMEQNGAKFYRQAARVAQRIADDPKALKANPSAKGAAAVLNQLADMEVEHEKTFSALREKISKEHPDLKPEFSSPDNEELITSYLRAAAEGKVFNLKEDPKELIGQEDSIEHILRTAIGLEKDSIIFYVAFKDAVPKSLGKEGISHIIAEEFGHITILSNKLSLRAK